MNMKMKKLGGKWLKFKTKEKLLGWKLKLEKMEKNVILQDEDNFWTNKQIEDLAGCSFRFAIDPKISEDGDDGKVTMCAFQGSQYWNPLEKILGLTIKDHQGWTEKRASSDEEIAI